MAEKFDGIKISAKVPKESDEMENPYGFTEVEKVMLKMHQDIKRALIMNGATEEQAERILRETKITITDENGVEKPIDN